MDEALTLQNVASIVTFVAPGYFAIQAYSLQYAKHDRDMSRLLIESVVFSLPLVAAVNILWQKGLHHTMAVAPDTGYSLLLLLVSVLAGLLFGFLRVHWPVEQIAAALGLGMPDEDFVRAQFARLPASGAVTVTLKSGRIFSGVLEQASVYSRDSVQKFYFKELAWADGSGKWDSRPGGLIVDADEIEYMETPRLKPGLTPARRPVRRTKHGDRTWVLP